jgi:hypothetical protein
MVKGFQTGLSGTFGLVGSTLFCAAAGTGGGVGDLAIAVTPPAVDRSIRGQGQTVSIAPATSIKPVPVGVPVTWLVELSPQLTMVSDKACAQKGPLWASNVIAAAVTRTANLDRNKYMLWIP